MGILANTEIMDRQLFSKRYYNLNQLFMRQIGIWPEQHLVKRIVFPIINVSIVASILIPEVIRMHDMWGEEVDHVIEGLPPMLIISLSWVKLLNGVVKQSAISHLLDRIENDWKTMEKNSSSIAILQKNAEEGRKLTILYAVLVYSAVTAFTGLPLIPLVLNFVAPLNESRPKIFLYETDYKVDPERYYYYMLCHYYVTSYVCIMVFVTVDTMFAVWVQHCCALFEIVGYNLRYGINSGIDLETSKPHSGEAVEYRNLCYCIKQHRDAIIFANLIESTYSTSLAYTTGVNMVVMSITGVLVVIKLKDIEEAMRFAALTAGQIYHLYFLTIPGQKVIDYSTSISEYAYTGDWSEFSPRAKMLLKLIIARSHKPCMLTAGKVYLINMENFSAVMKTSISYFTVFSSLR